MMEVKKVLVLSPHTDDGELASGATIARFIEEGKEIFLVVFSYSATQHELPSAVLKDECLRAAGILGISNEKIYFLKYRVRTLPEHRQEILDELIKLKQEIKPDLVIVPSSNDTHQDHATVYWESLRAFKKEASIWGYEHSWNNLTFTNDVFVKLTEEQVEKKVRALKEYKSQSEKGYMNEINIRSLLIAHGTQLDVSYAEAFELVRLIH